MLTLDGKLIVVTGASSGIGQAIAVLASKLGSRVILIGRNIERLEVTLSQMMANKHIMINQDILDYDALKQALYKILDQDQLVVNGVVHSAGIELTKPFSMLKAQNIRDVLEVNLIAGLELFRIVSKRQYVPEYGASYLFISSIMAEIGGVGLTAYCASKSAITSTIKAIALELANRKIRVNSIQPGYVHTSLLERTFSNMTEAEIARIVNRHPLGIGKPIDVANLCCFLLSDLAGWITGANIPIDGGYSIG